MQVKLQKHLLAQTIEFLYELTLKGRYSRHRTKIIQELSKHLEELSKDEESLLEEYCERDENGEFKTQENGKYYDIEDTQSYLQERDILHNEHIVLEGANLETSLKTVREALDIAEDEFSEEKATLYAHLCDVFKVDEEIE